MQTKEFYQNIEINPDATPEASGERLRRVRNLANLSRKEMCEDSQLNINTLKGWEIGRYGGLTVKGADRVIQRVAREGVQCTIEWLLYNIGKGPTIVTDYTSIQESPPETEYTATRFSDEEENIAAELMLFRQHYNNTIDFIVTDNGMLPLYQIGDYVAGVKRKTTKIETVIGENCIVQTKEGHILLRNVRKGSQDDSYNLVCLNTETLLEQPVMYDVRLASAAPVIWQRRKNRSF